MKAKFKKWRSIAIALLGGIALTIPMATIAVSCSSGSSGTNNETDQNTGNSGGNGNNGGSQNPNEIGPDGLTSFEREALDLTTVGKDGTGVHNHDVSVDPNNVNLFGFDPRQFNIYKQKVRWFEGGKPITYTFNFSITNIDARISRSDWSFDWGSYENLSFTVSPKSQKNQAYYNTLTSSSFYSNEEVNFKPAQQCQIVLSEKNDTYTFTSYLSNNPEDVPVVYGSSNNSLYTIPVMSYNEFWFGFGSSQEIKNNNILSVLEQPSRENKTSKRVKEFVHIDRFTSTWSITKKVAQ